MFLWYDCRCTLPDGFYIYARVIRVLTPKEVPWAINFSWESGYRGVACGSAWGRVAARATEVRQKAGLITEPRRREAAATPRHEVHGTAILAYIGVVEMGSM